MTDSYVEKLGARTSEGSIRKLFETHGGVCRVHIVNVVADQDASHRNCFGLVEMTNDVEAQEAIAALNGADLEGSTISVQEALTKRMGSSGGE